MYDRHFENFIQSPFCSSGQSWFGQCTSQMCWWLCHILGWPLPFCLFGIFLSIYGLMLLVLVSRFGCHGRIVNRKQNRTMWIVQIHVAGLILTIITVETWRTPSCNHFTKAIRAAVQQIPKTCVMSLQYMTLLICACHPCTECHAEYFWLPSSKLRGTCEAKLCYPSHPSMKSVVVFNSWQHARLHWYCIALFYAVGFSCRSAFGRLG